MTSPPHLRLVQDPVSQPEDADEADGAAFDPARPHPPAWQDDVDTRGRILGEEGDEDLPPDEAAARARRALRARQAVVALVAFQGLGVLFNAPRDWQYALAGAVAPPAWLAFPACLALWLATAWLALGRARGGTRATFVACAAGFALAVPFWGLASWLTWPFEAGATLALAGAWLVHRERQLEPH